jgi:hypothetical protein
MVKISKRGVCMQFRTRFFKDKLKVPRDVVNDIDLKNGDLVDIDLERVEE